MKFSVKFVAFLTTMAVVTAFPGQNKTEVKSEYKCPTTGYDMEAWESFMADLLIETWHECGQKCDGFYGNCRFWIWAPVIFINYVVKNHYFFTVCHLSQ